MNTQVMAADLVIENAVIWSAGRKEFAEFAAITAGRFTHVGNYEPACIDATTKRLDARGHPVIPGLIDAHLHMLGGGLSENLGINLRPAQSKAQFIQIITDWLRNKKIPPNGWLVGGRWSTEAWSKPENPNRHWLDPVTAERPTFLYRMDGHSALVNSAALKLAGITAATADPPGGKIERDPVTHKPTGILRESAIQLVAQHRPAPTPQQQLAGCRTASRLALRNGITAVGDIVESNTLPTYQTLADRIPNTPAEPAVRFYLYISDPDWGRILPAVQAFKSNPHQVQIAGLKDYIDGSLGSRTAAMAEPYRENHTPPDAPTAHPNHGLYLAGIQAGQLVRNLQIAADNNLQPIYHAIGDAATQLVLNTLEQVYPNPAAIRAARPRIEHAQHLLPDDVPRFGALGVIASMQPYHKFDDARFMDEYLGAARSKNAYKFQSLLKAGTNLAFGSDWPIVTINPFAAIETAVNNTTALGRTWQPHENITITEALTCYTTMAATALNAENEIGQIAPGYRADFVILNRSPFADHPQRKSFADIGPLLTAVGGRIVFNDLSNSS